MPGVLASAIHMVGTPGNTVAFLTSMSASVVSTSKRTRSSSSLPSAQRAQHDGRQRIDVEQRQDADDLVLAGQGHALRVAPELVDRAGGAEIGVAQHGALRLAGGAARVLQQGDVIDADRGPLPRQLLCSHPPASASKRTTPGASGDRRWWGWPRGRKPCRRRRSDGRPVHRPSASAPAAA